MNLDLVSILIYFISFSYLHNVLVTVIITTTCMDYCNYHNVYIEEYTCINGVYSISMIHWFDYSGCNSSLVKISSCLLIYY